MLVKEKGALDQVGPLQGLGAGAFASGAFWLGAFAGFTDTSGADFVGGFVAGAFEGAPHVPACDGAIGAPALAESEELFRLRHALLAVDNGPALLYAEVVDGEHVGAAKAEDQKHLDGPGTDAADGDEALDEFVVGHGQGLFVSGNDAVDGFLCEVFHGENFCAGEAGLAEDRLAQLEHLFRGRRATVAAQSLDAAEDGGGGFARNGLIGDGFDEHFIGTFGAIGLDAEWGGFGDKGGEFFVFGGEVTRGFGEIEGERHREEKIAGSEATTQ
jgi:hypothetical protein